MNKICMGIWGMTNLRDQQANCDIPPGCANFIRLVSIIYVLDQEGYDGWFGLKTEN